MGVEIPDGDIEVARITIIKTFTDNHDAEGGIAVFTSYTEGMTLLDALGLLTFAVATTPENFATGDDAP